MSSIHIRNIKKEDTDDGKTCLSALICENDSERTMTFSAPSKYREFLCADRADPFVVALLSKALKQGSNIECEAPVSEKLLYSLNHLYFSALTFVFHELKDSIVIAEKALPCQTNGITGLIISGDDYDSNVLSKLDQISEYKPEILLTDGKELSEDFFRDLDERKISVLPVTHNIDKFYPLDEISTKTIRRLAPVLALQGLIGQVLYIPQFNDREFQLDKNNPDRYEALSVECFSTDSLHLLFTPF